MLYLLIVFCVELTVLDAFDLCDVKAVTGAAVLSLELDFSPSTLNVTD